jgi:hypothetical protein
MDIEGAEAAVLHGAPAWLDRVRSLKVEVHPPATIDSVSATLRDRGFRCWTDAEHWSCVCAVRVGVAGVAAAGGRSSTGAPA